MAGTIGLVQNDIKRVLAYSTVSQLGYMFLAMGVGAFAGRHLPSLHARVLQGAAVPWIRRRDSRASRRAGPAQHGRPAPELPVTYWTFLIGTLAMPASRPAGFFSKDEILWRRSRRTQGALDRRCRHGISDRDVHVPAASISRSSGPGARRALARRTGHRRTVARARRAARSTQHRAHRTSPRRPTRDGDCARRARGRIVVAGFVGVPDVLRGGNKIEAFLEPSFKPQ